MLQAHPAMTARATGTRSAGAGTRSAAAGTRAAAAGTRAAAAGTRAAAARAAEAAARAAEGARTAKTAGTRRAGPSAAGTVRAEGNPGPAGTARAPSAGRTSGTSPMSSVRGTPCPRRTDRWQVGPRRRVLVVTVRAVGPGRGARRQKLLLRHGAPPESGCGR